MKRMMASWVPGPSSLAASARQRGALGGLCLCFILAALAYLHVGIDGVMRMASLRESDIAVRIGQAGLHLAARDPLTLQAAGPRHDPKTTGLGDTPFQQPFGPDLAITADQSRPQGPEIRPVPSRPVTDWLARGPPR